jgi:hypothetical protein
MGRVDNLRLRSGLGLGGLSLRCLVTLGGFLLRRLSGGGLGLGVVGRGPEGEVVTEKLHDEGAVTVGLLGEGVKLGDGIIEGLLGEVAGTVGRVQNLVVEDREVQRKAETDGVGGGQFGLGDVGSALLMCHHVSQQSSSKGYSRSSIYLVGIVSSSSGKLALLARSELGKVAVVVTLPAGRNTRSAIETSGHERE